MSDRLKTARLTLVPLTLSAAKVALEDRASLGTFLSLQVSDEWPNRDIEHFLPFYIELLQTDPTALGWGVWLMVHTAEQSLIGNLSFSGKPNEAGIVEMGYEVLPDYRDRGYASEAVRALVNWAFTQPAMNRIFAQCHIDNTASMRVLEKLGMQRLWVKGDIWHWQLKR